ncbi:MAG: indole-3-glycerol phosphate synthase TrpC [Pseudomonadota bacterium]
MAADILSRIVATTRETVAAAQARRPLADLKARASGASPVRPFLPDSDPRPVSIIAEIKRASPSKGDIAIDLDPARLAASYEAGGAAALSVLTDAPFFKGSALDLMTARAAVSLPVLRKDFIVTEYQVYEARSWGADAVLLIARILSPHQMAELCACVRALGMEPLVEIHTEADLETIPGACARLIGINNRDLKSFDTSLDRAIGLAGRLAPHQVPVAASGIAAREDIARNLAHGIRHFLIGESLVRAADPVAFLKDLANIEETP